LVSGANYFLHRSTSWGTTATRSSSKESFGEHIFTPSKLEEAVEQVVQSYLAHVRSIEGKMLVAIRADVANFPDTYFLARLDDKMLQQSFDQAISRSMEAVKWDLGGDVGTAVVSFIAGEVLAQVSVQLGIRAGILGAGASSSWFTFGIGLAVGAIVDAIVSWVYDWYATPRATWQQTWTKNSTR
jgi:hypothetical protein